MSEPKNSAKWRNGIDWIEFARDELADRFEGGELPDAKFVLDHAFELPEPSAAVRPVVAFEAYCQVCGETAEDSEGCTIWADSVGADWTRDEQLHLLVDGRYAHWECRKTCPCGSSDGHGIGIDYIGTDQTTCRDVPAEEG